ncbi:MAG: hypothetical protein HPY76_10630 [Anaerolineae bacterium]|nr:hypothetical protein [Anaerolineae bacterium]
MHQNIQRLSLIPIFLVAWLQLSSFTVTPSKISFHEAAAFYTFGDTVSFRVTCESENPITEALLFVAIAGQSTRVIPVTPNSTGALQYDLDASSDPIRPFAEVRYWYQIKDGKGEEGRSREYSFVYTDNRFSWSSHKDEQFEIYWSTTDARIGRQILAIARRSLQNALKYYPAATTEAIKIYIYENTDDLRLALAPGQHTWTVGHASPEDATILIVLADGMKTKAEVERLLPHEITHILQAAYSRDNFSSLPAWLVEGSASVAELRPDPERRAVLQSAAAANALIPIEELCTSFPNDDAAAYLAYAESESFVQFLVREYGADSLVRLTEQSSPERTCQEAFYTTYKQSLPEIEAEWQKQVVGVSSANNPAGDMTALAALLVLLILAPLAPALAIAIQTRRGK